MTQVSRTDRTAATEAITPQRASGERPTRVAITVVGMHRSGTSAAARTLSLLGADLPSHLMSAWEANAPGHWEPERIVALNEELLANAATSWHDVSRFPTAWYGSPSEVEFRRRLVDLLSEEYGSSRLFVLKDPRLSRLVPFWLGAAADFGASPSFVIALRNPLEVAASLKARDGFSFPKGLLLWLRHMIDAERDTRGHPRAFLSFSRLLADWEREARAVSQQLGITWPTLNHRARANVEQFLDRQHQHHSASARDLQAHTAAVTWVTRAYEVLEAAATEGEAPSAETLDEVGSILDEADAAYGPLLAEAGLASEEGARELDRSRRELEDRDEALGRLQGELDERTSRVEVLGVKLAEREAEWDREREQIARLEEERETIRSELSLRSDEIEAVRVELTERDQRLSRRAAELEQALSEASAREVEQADDRRRLERAHGELDEVRRVAKERAAEIESLTRRLEQREDEIRRLVAEADRRMASPEKAQELTGEIEERGKEIERLRALVNRRKGALETLTEKLERRDERIRRLEGEVGARHSHIDELRERVRLRGADLEERRVEVERQAAALAEAHAERDRLRSEAKRASDELSQRDAALAAAVGQRTEAIRERDGLRAELTRRLRERDHFTADLRAQVWEKEHLRSHLEGVEAEVKHAQEAIESVRHETALTYLKARPSNNWRSTMKLLSWVLPLPREAGRRYVRTFLALRKSESFDHGFYLSQYPDVAVRGTHALMHYIEHGVADGRDPSPSFSTSEYLAEHPELEKSGENPLLHYLRAREAATTHKFAANRG